MIFLFFNKLIRIKIFKLVLMKSFLIFITSLFFLVAYGQVKTEESAYLKKENYIPYPGTSNDIEKTVHVAIHIWQRADGSGNMRDIPAHYARFIKIIDWMNGLYAKNPDAPIPGVPYKVDSIYDSKIRFKLEKIYFYKDATPDSSYFYSTDYLHNKKLNDYLKEHFPERVKTLNLHIFRGSYAKASGYSEYGSIGTFYRVNPEMSEDDVHDWWLSKHWAHEIGHGLDLWHTYDANGSYQQNCKSTYRDFLWDVYDTTAVPSGKGCNVDLITDKSNNNLMGGQEGNSMSVLQMGIAHRATVIENLYNKGYNMRDFVTGYGYWSKAIENNEVWNVSMKMYQDIVVKKGATLTIKTEIQMVPKAKIIVEKGAKLIIDGGVITNEKYYNKEWKGIIVRKAKKSSSVESGELIQMNGGKVSHAKVKYK
ncbi:MAG: hypothetical protein BGO87_11645 [Flavobacteriia bacterium 40-80]|nr:MAG: hypothetical protein BGO87_11645 [Flavobacteriia bacterium 40-80]